MTHKALHEFEDQEEHLRSQLTAPLRWARRHWAILTVVVLAAGGSVGVTAYHRHTQHQVADQSWAALVEVQGDPDLRESPEQYQDALREVASAHAGSVAEPFARLELGFSLRDERKLEEAREVFQDVATRWPDQLPGRTARSNVEAIDSDARWEEARAADATPASTTSPDNPIVEFVTTRGPFQVELWEDATPVAVAHLINLVEQGYYEQGVVSRVATPAEGAGVVQFGQRFNVPEDGSVPPAGPGYLVKAEVSPALHHDEGTISFATAPGTYVRVGGELVINTSDNRSARDGRYPVFGKITEGMDVVKSLLQGQDLILKASVIRKRDHPYETEHLPEEP